MGLLELCSETEQGRFVPITASKHHTDGKARFVARHRYGHCRLARDVLRWREGKDFCLAPVYITRLHVYRVYLANLWDWCAEHGRQDERRGQHAREATRHRGGRRTARGRGSAVPPATAGHELDGAECEDEAGDPGESAGDPPA